MNQPVTTSAPLLPTPAAMGSMISYSIAMMASFVLQGLSIWNIVETAQILHNNYNNYWNACDSNLKIYVVGSIVISGYFSVAIYGLCLAFQLRPFYRTHTRLSTLFLLLLIAWAIMGTIWHHQADACGANFGWHYWQSIIAMWVSVGVAIVHTIFLFNFGAFQTMTNDIVTFF